MLVPIGAWCRTAYQVNRFNKKSWRKRYSFPYDWTITPFFALKNTLRRGLDHELILREENLSISEVGSIRDMATGVIHHHDFTPKIIGKFSKDSEINENGVPLKLFDTDLIMKARQRFLYTYNNLLKLKDNGERIGFVRWNRIGHPDPEVPELFEGENCETLNPILSGFLGHDHFILLIVKTIHTDDRPRRKDIICSYEKNKFGINATIKEKHTGIFKGDNRSWNVLLKKYIKEERV